MIIIGRWANTISLAAETNDSSVNHNDNATRIPERKTERNPHKNAAIK
jgi:hypothetical protein